jgi:hypothetical protein
MGKLGVGVIGVGAFGSRTARRLVGADSVSGRRRVYKGNIDSPKTRRSIRQVAMTNGTIGLLDSWIERFRDREPSAWLFPSEGLATPLRRDVWRRNILPKLRKVHLEWATFQVMRPSIRCAIKAGWH